MAIDRIGSPLPPISPAKSKTGSKASRSEVRDGEDRNPSIAAYEAEKDANVRVNTATKLVRDTETAMGQELDRVKEDYTRQSEAESARQENAYEVQQNKGYERLRDLQRAQAQELNRVRRDGERTLQETKEYYGQAIRGADQRGDESLRQIEHTSHAQVDYEKKLTDAELDATKRESKARYEETKSREDQKYSALVDATRRQYEQLEQKSTDATARSEEHFNERYQNLKEQNEQILNNLYTRGSEQVKEVRADTSHKLAAYSDRQRDPFYKLVDLGAEIHDIGDSYVLTAKIPDYEQQKVSVSIKGNELVLSGYRRNEEKLEEGPGHTKVTASHQSFSESFPLTWPVDGKKLEKIFDGDELMVKVPKKQDYNVHTVYDSSKGQKHGPFAAEKVERPKFPENLPDTVNVNQRKPAGEEAEAYAQAPLPKSKGQRTLD